VDHLIREAESKDHSIKKKKTDIKERNTGKGGKIDSTGRGRLLIRVQNVALLHHKYEGA